MKKTLILILILNSPPLFAQNLCHTDILNQEEVNPASVSEQYLQYDFSGIWLRQNHTLGIIGDNYQRLYIRLLSVVKNENNPNEYLVYGRSRVKNNRCDFVGKIIVEEIRETHREHFGVDNEHKGKSKTQGLLTARYEFYESKTSKHSGIFSGVLQSKWFLDRNNTVKYDDINLHSDGYFNNSFVGVWQMYQSDTKKICHWGDYRVPDVKCDFDIGAGEFSVNEIYDESGWANYRLARGSHHETEDVIKARQEEDKEWWK